MSIRVQGQPYQEIDVENLSAQDREDLLDEGWHVWKVARPKPGMALPKNYDSGWQEFRSWLFALRAQGAE